MKKAFYVLSIAATIIATNSCQKPKLPELQDLTKEDASVALDWYKLQFKFLLERNSTMNGVYFGYLGIGLYESIRYGIKNSASFSTSLYQMPVMPAIENNKTYCWTASANAAMARMIRYFNSGLTTANLASIDSLENLYNEKINLQTNASDFIRSQALGRSVATAIYTWSQSDNFNPTNTGYIAPVFDGAWVPTPPAMISPPASPYISNARPLLAADLTAVAPPFPFAYSEETSSDFYKMVKEVYDVFQGLTTEQKNIALFWVDQGNGLGYTPDGHNMLFVSQAIEIAKVNIAVAAEAFAKAGIAERESNIVCFRAKYKYNLLRPVTYIRKLTDPNWLPFIPTPPFPEYPAAHAFVTAAVMQAVTNLLGEHVSVTDHAYDFRGWTPRTYPSLFSAAEEAGISRLYGGIHYRVSINAGLNLGRDLGNMIGKIKLFDSQSVLNPEAY